MMNRFGTAVRTLRPICLVRTWKREVVGTGESEVFLGAGTPEAFTYIPSVYGRLLQRDGTNIERCDIEPREVTTRPMHATCKRCLEAFEAEFKVAYPKGEPKQ